MERYVIEFLLYAAVHLYCFLRLRAVVSSRRAFLRAVGGVFIFMVLAPFVVFFVDRAGVMWAARPLAVVGYMWIAVILWFTLLVMAVDLWNLVVRLLARAVRPARRLAVPGRPAFALAGVVVLCAACWGLYEAGAVRLVQVTIETDRLEPGSTPLRIVQLADLHLGLILGQGRLSKVLDLVAEARPDVVVATGDTVDASFRGLDEEAAMLAGCRPPLGKFAVLGNHEYNAGVEQSLAFLEAACFTLLRAESTPVGDRLIVAGVDDPAGRIWGKEVRADEDAALPAGEGRPLTVLLKHRPSVSEGSLGRFDLQLSGHTHGGQIFPFGLFEALQYPHLAGLFRLDGGSILYVSSGAGTWGPPLRLLAPPEVTLFILEPAGGP